MTLAQTLTKRKEIVKELNRLWEEITSGVFIKAEEKDPMYFPTRYTKIVEISDSLAKLNKAIDEANFNKIVTLSSMRTCEAILSNLNKVRSEMLSEKNSWRGEDKVKQYNLETINELIKEEEQKFRAYNDEMQKFNWTKEVSEV